MSSLSDIPFRQSKKNCAASVKVRPVPVHSGKAGCSKPGPADCDEVLS